MTAVSSKKLLRRREWVKGVVYDMFDVARFQSGRDLCTLGDRFDIFGCDIQVA